MSMGFKFAIEKLFVVETGTYNDQWRRPYKVGVTGQAINALEERLNGSQNLQITPSMLSGITSQIIQPNAVPEEVIKIANGWGEKRFRFNMKVHVWSHLGTHSIEIVQGFTDYLGGNKSGALAPDMNFFINSITTVREVDVPTPMGVQKRYMMGEPNHILSSEPSLHGGGSGLNFYANQGSFRMRPEDIFTVMPRIQAIDDPSSYDDTVRLSNIPCMSKMSSAIPATYTAKILTGYKNASTLQDFGQGYGAICGQAKGYVADMLCTMEPFLRAISNIRGVPTTSTFSFADLLKIDPEATNKLDLIFIGATKQHTVHTAGQTENWGAATLEAQAATMLSQAIPGLALECSLSLVSFTSTNRTLNMMPFTNVTNAKSIVDADMSAQVQDFKNKLDNYVLVDLSQCGLIDYEVIVECDINNETRISLSLANGPHTPFVTPSFSCAMTVPLLTANAVEIKTLTEGFDSLVGSIMPIADDSIFGSYPGATESSMFGNHQGV